MIHIYLTETTDDVSVAAHELLRTVLTNEYGISNPDILKNEYGKLYLASGPYFSISHSYGFAAVAFSDHEVGLDIEVLRSFHPKLPVRIFSQLEQTWFSEMGLSQNAFFTLWTLKESYYKYLGTGIPLFPNETNFYKDQEWHLDGSTLFFSVMEVEKLLITVCGNEQQEIMIHRV